jgi:mannose-6-phosphate isomerase-like protein (cupin superfamily)
MTIIRAAETPRFTLPGVTFAGYAAPSRGSDDLCTWRLTVEGAFASPEPHTLDRDEIFMVVSGAVKLTPDGETIAAGDAAVAPAGSPIQLVNAGDTAAEVIVAIPAGFTAKAADGSSIGTPPWAQ